MFWNIANLTNYANKIHVEKYTFSFYIYLVLLIPPAIQKVTKSNKQVTTLWLWAMLNWVLWSYTFISVYIQGI